MMLPEHRFIKPEIDKTEGYISEVSIDANDKVIGLATRLVGYMYILISKYIIME